MSIRGAGAWTLIPGLLLLWGCAGGESADLPRTGDVDAGAPTVQVDLPDREEFVRNGLIHPGETRAALAERLGPPDSIHFEVVANRHVPNVTDSLFTVHYRDLTAGIHRPGSGGELLSSVEVTGNRHLRHPVIGMDAAAMLAAFGPPDERTDSTLTYRCTTCIAGDDPVIFTLESGEVRRVRFGYYVD